MSGSALDGGVEYVGQRHRLVRLFEILSVFRVGISNFLTEKLVRRVVNFSFRISFRRLHESSVLFDDFQDLTDIK